MAAGVAKAHADVILVAGRFAQRQFEQQAAGIVELHAMAGVFAADHADRRAQQRGDQVFLMVDQLHVVAP